MKMKAVALLALFSTAALFAQEQKDLPGTHSLTIPDGCVVTVTCPKIPTTTTTHTGNGKKVTTVTTTPAPGVTIEQNFNFGTMPGQLPPMTEQKIIAPSIDMSSLTAEMHDANELKRAELELKKKEVATQDTIAYQEQRQADSAHHQVILGVVNTGFHAVDTATRVYEMMNWGGGPGGGSSGASKAPDIVEIMDTFSPNFTAAFTPSNTVNASGGTATNTANGYGGIATANGYGGQATAAAPAAPSSPPPPPNPPPTSCKPPKSGGKKS